MECFLRAVLFAEGVGSDPSNFRPSADATQWWNRRDALVRCVAAFLFGPTATNNHNNKELVILFDQDWACMHMQIVFNNNNNNNNIISMVPTEQTIISLWKRAAKQPGQRVAHHGLSCRMVTVMHAMNNEKAPPPSTNASKRDILHYLQSACSMDFLRAHRLNSSSDVLLRKFNKDALLRVFREWTDQQQPQPPQKHCDSNNHSSSNNNNPPSQSTTSASNPDYTSLQHILQKLLQPRSNEIQQVIAATLHESSDHELPCWDEDAAGTTNDSVSASASSSSPSSSSSSTQLQVVLFLGAVRDMHSAEHDVLRRVCAATCTADDQRLTVPLLNIRLGPVAEFTSKILTVVAFHHCHGHLGPAIHRMWGVAQPTNRAPAAKSETNGAPMLHFVCLVPISSGGISNQLEHRSNNLVLWSMVRCTVTSLWRSRLARGGGRNHSSDSETVVLLRNRLTFLFSDGALLTLRQEELVASMAEQHRAAPSEHQILTALQQKVESCLVRPWKDVAESEETSSTATAVAPSSLDWKACSKATAKALIRMHNVDDNCRERADTNLTFVLDFEEKSVDLKASSREVARCDKTLFYSPVAKFSASARNEDSSAASAVASSAIIVFSLSSHRSNDDDDSASAALLVERQKLLVRALRRKKFPVVAGSPSLVNTITATGSSLSSCHCIDGAAMIVTMLQHLCYQGRLLGLIQGCVNNSTSDSGRDHQRLPKKRRNTADE